MIGSKRLFGVYGHAARIEKARASKLQALLLRLHRKRGGR
jgi:hypothetical protein